MAPRASTIAIGIVIFGVVIVALFLMSENNGGDMSSHSSSSSHHDHHTISEEHHRDDHDHPAPPRSIQSSLVNPLFSEDGECPDQRDVTTHHLHPRRRINRRNEAYSFRHPILVDMFLDERYHLIALFNTNLEDVRWGLLRKKQVEYEHARWECFTVATAAAAASSASSSSMGRFEDIDNHNKTAIVDFGNTFREGDTVHLQSEFHDFGCYVVKRGLLHHHLHRHHRRFNLVASLLLRDEVETPSLLERWIDWHRQTVGVEHVLAYVNLPQVWPSSSSSSSSSLFSSSSSSPFLEKLSRRYASLIEAGLLTLVPFWFNHSVPFGDQVAQIMHALYSTRGGVSKWLLSCDIDEYILTKRPLIETFGPLLGTDRHAIQIASYVVNDGSSSGTSDDGHLEKTPQYGTDLKGKVIFRTGTTTGASVHMVTDNEAMDRTAQDTEITRLHLAVPSGVAKIAHFHRKALGRMDELLPRVQKQFCRSNSGSCIHRYR